MKFQFIFRHHTYIIDSIIDFSSSHSISEVPHDKMQIVADSAPPGFVRDVSNKHLTRIVSYDNTEIWYPQVTVKEKFNNENQKIYYTIDITG